MQSGSWRAPSTYTATACSLIRPCLSPGFIMTACWDDTPVLLSVSGQVLKMTSVKGLQKLGTAPERVQMCRFRLSRSER